MSLIVTSLILTVAKNNLIRKQISAGDDFGHRGQQKNLDTKETFKYLEKEKHFYDFVPMI